MCLNETAYPQPRRKSWSIVVRDAHLNDDGVLVRTMYAYGKPNSRIRDELHATPMPWEIALLGVQLFQSVRHVLSTVCASSPPNHCQLLAYYGLFDSKMGRHKDDHTLQHMYDWLFNQIDSRNRMSRVIRMDVEEAAKKSKGAMIGGSDVLIYSVGHLPVVFSFCYAQKDLPFVERRHYKIHPDMQINLPHGSLFVFKAIDDLFFYHEVSIDWGPGGACETDYRLAFVFRWLCTECEFRVDASSGGDGGVASSSANSSVNKCVSDHDSSDSESD